MLLLPTMRATHENELMRFELGGDAIGDGSVPRRTDYVLSVKGVRSADDQRCEAGTYPIGERY